MHERTRRTLCRLAFLVLAILPTISTFVWVGYRCSPVYAAAERAAWEEKLFSLTGLLCRVGRIERPVGGTWLLHQVEFLDPDGGDALGTVRQIELAEQPEGLVVLLSQPELAPGKFLRLWDALHERVLRGPVVSRAVQIRSGEITLRAGRRAQTFTSVLCQIEPRGGGLVTRIDFQLAGIEMPRPAQVRIERNRQTVPPTTRWTLQTDAPLPCDLFVDYLPALERLGDRSEFVGSVTMTLAPLGWTGQVSGQFQQVDLSAATDPLPHRLSGLATVTVRDARVEGGRIESASGSVFSPGGTVSRSLVASLAENLPLRSSEVALAAHEPLATYEQLGFQFDWSAAGISLTSLDPSVGDTILFSRNELLLSTNGQARMSLVSVLRALSPESPWMVPATEEMRALMNVLPLPAATPASTGTRLRLHPTR